MFVGGCTMAEVAALRFLSQQVIVSLDLRLLGDSVGFKDITCALVQEENNVEYLVATTSIITGESFIESLATKLEAPTF